MISVAPAVSGHRAVLSDRLHQDNPETLNYKRNAARGAG
jgi:hypothetical protein